MQCWRPHFQELHPGHPQGQDRYPRLPRDSGQQDHTQSITATRLSFFFFLSLLI